MKKIFIKIKPFIKYVLIFVFFLVWNLIVQPLNLDETWNYGFVYNISRGLVPYRDFNMVITPLYPFIMAIFSFAFGGGVLVLHIMNALMITLIFSVIEKLIGDKAYLCLVLFCIPLSVLFPSYNLFLLILFILLIYLERNGANDYLIGIILSCCILTKQSVGICLVLPSLYYLRDFNKIKKRFIGLIIPIVVFIVYLILNDAFFQFLDLCVLGLFDFTRENGNFINIFVLFSIVLFIINLFFIKSDYKNINNYYLLAFFSILIPLFDLYHFQIYLIAFLVILFLNKNMKLVINLKLFCVGIVLGVTFLMMRDKVSGDIIYPNNINNFEYRLIDKKYIQFTKDINAKIKEYSDREIIFLGADGYYFKIINNEDIGYLDLINTGNWGYDGSSKLLDTIKNKKDALFFVDEKEIGSNKQTDQNALKYVTKNGKKIDESWKYSIYILEE